MLSSTVRILVMIKDKDQLGDRTVWNTLPWLYLLSNPVVRAMCLCAEQFRGPQLRETLMIT